VLATFHIHLSLRQTELKKILLGYFENNSRIKKVASITI